ncbi:MAG: signal peptidase II [Selenomonadaceae bacterium]|uniref:Lipoprotein signal peptidase n=2 Tax=Anaerovibrio TaxID=82373 RepID=A0A6I2UGV4_9FIRM|nr:signal peptidase II [Anaerovibrio slackiae]MBQ2411029.1 signal peptidase II [Selenomonadaceae bacterium]MBQ5584885.1 signal peptidase II [Selenomonadaceae bacterium]MBQ5650667.1 signal peptidase II [Selenomonadaceae bacterium]MBQ5732765.1 signal peptidase II [Selenomonadaceae bacterium]MBQ5845739.1 signal peptidase II [Selenomonadaceae bacterium]
MPLGIGILVFIIDQLVKHLVVSTMHLGQSLPVIKGIFHITYVLNPGAAFGMLEHQRWFFILVALAAVLLGAAFYKKLQQESFLMRSGAGLLLGGAVGNLADRIQSGLVVDFLDFRIWPVFNIADIAICAGAGILIFDIWQRRNEDDICS